VVANADGSEGFGPTELHREAALMFALPDGRIESGAVGADLLRADPAAPFGVRLDQGAVTAAFRRQWDGPGDGARLVLVAASDLARVHRYGHYATAAQAHTLRTRALAASDALFGELLRNVDAARDAVVVIGAPSENSAHTLDVAAMHAPGAAPGYLE